MVPKSTSAERIKENFESCLALSTVEKELISTITSRIQPAERNMVSVGHIGFDTFDENSDQPVAA